MQVFNTLLSAGAKPALMSMPAGLRLEKMEPSQGLYPNLQNHAYLLQYQYLFFYSFVSIFRHSQAYPIFGTFHLSPFSSLNYFTFSTFKLKRELPTALVFDRFQLESLPYCS